MRHFLLQIIQAFKGFFSVLNPHNIRIDGITMTLSSFLERESVSGRSERLQMFEKMRNERLRMLHAVAATCQSMTTVQLQWVTLDSTNIQMLGFGLGCYARLGWG